MSGDPIIVVEGVAAIFGVNRALYTLSDTGTLAYVPTSPTTQSTLGWVSRDGEMTEPLLRAQVIGWPRLSPDGANVAFSRGTLADTDLWIRDLESEQETKLTETGGSRTVRPRGQRTGQP